MVLGDDVLPGTDDWDIFIKEVKKEIGEEKKEASEAVVVQNFEKPKPEAMREKEVIRNEEQKENIITNLLYKSKACTT